MNWTDVLTLASKGNLTPDKRVEKSEEEWKKLLTPEQFRIARHKGTEHAFSGEYCEAHNPGLYACLCCGTPLFDSRENLSRVQAGQAFTQGVKDNVIKYEDDRAYGMHRVEVMCNVCDAHLGHVFPDGPRPTGLRYCINSASIKLVEE